MSELSAFEKPSMIHALWEAAQKEEKEQKIQKQLEDLQKQNRIMKKALRHLDAGYSGMFGNQEISAKDESWIMAPIIVRDALKKIGEVKE